MQVNMERYRSDDTLALFMKSQNKRTGMGNKDCQGEGCGWEDTGRGM